MGVASRIVAGVTAGAIVLAGGYLWADVHDFVPGYLTIAPRPAPPIPFPTVEVPAAENRLAEALKIIETAAPVPLADRVAGLARDLAADKQLMGERVAVVVSDSLTGELLAQVNQLVPMVPASVQKLITGAAAVEVLDTDRTLKTKVIRSGSNEIYLAGEGDMMLTAGKGTPEALNGRAGLADLVAQAAASLTQEGLDNVQLFLDDSLFVGSTTGPWELDLVTDGYAAPVATVAIDVGRRSAGMYAPRYLDPGMEAAKEFASQLTELGFTVSDPTRKAFGAPGQGASTVGDQVIGVVESAPLGEVIDYAMKVSDNTLTEVLGYTVARELGMEASFAGATKAVVQVIEQLGVNTTGMELVDCSGLGADSYVTATSINELLNIMASAQNPRLREAAIGLSIAGLDGTLGGRFLERNGRGLVRGKTGSLNNVTSLAGTVVTLDERLLTFVILADQTPGGQYGPRTAMDGFVESLAECGCQ